MILANKRTTRPITRDRPRSLLPSERSSPEMNIAVKGVKHAAPGPYLGFALQPVRFCFHLLESPKGAKVSLEHLDDVAVHYADGSLMLEQTKSALKSNPLADWSEGFWKAVANWIDALSADKFPSGSRFCLYVTPPHQGEFAQAMSDASPLRPPAGSAGWPRSSGAFRPWLFQQLSRSHAIGMASGLQITVGRE